MPVPDSTTMCTYSSCHNTTMVGVAAVVDGPMCCSLGRNGIISTTQCMMKEHICRFTVAQKGTLMQLSYSGSPLTVVVGGVVPLQELCCSSRQQDDEAAPWYI